MNYKRILNVLTRFGLTTNDAEVYIHLAISGPQRARSIAEALNMPTRQVYRSLQHLMEKHIVASQGHPTRFVADPFQDALEILEESSLRDAENMEQKKEVTLRIWQSIIDEK